MEISVIDLGAATLNLLRAKLSQGELVERHEFQRFVRLGEGTLLSGVISPDAWNSALTGIECLLACARPAQPEQLIAVATSVLREAANGPAFKKTLYVLYGLRVRVLSPAEEAMLAFRGAQSALDSMDPVEGPLLVLDLGGGCVNFALEQGSGWPLTASLALGTMRLRPAFAPDGLLSRSDAGALTTLVRRSLAMNTLRMRNHAPTLALCSRAARAVRQYATRGELHAGPTGPLTRRQVIAAQRELLDTSASELVARGVEEDDADSLAIATTVLRAILEALDTDNALVVDRGLREGVVLEHARRMQVATEACPHGSTSSL